MTTKQATYRQDLIDRELNRLAKEGVSGAGDVRAKMTRLVSAGLLVSLPEPTDARTASEQIDALKGSIMVYGQRNQDWAQPILAKTIGAFGEHGEREQTFDPAYEVALRETGTTGMDVNSAVLDRQRAEWIATVREAVAA